MDANSKLIQWIQKFSYALQKNKYMSAISGGLMTLLPITMIGAFSSLFAGLPIPAYQDFISKTGLHTIILAPAQVTTNILSLYAVTIIAYNMAKELNKDPVMPSLLALLMFLILTPLQTLESGETVIPMTWLGAAGLFVAMFVGILSTKLYAFIVDKKLVINLPDGVPPTVSKTFTSLVPAILMALVFMLVRGVFSVTPFQSIHIFIFGFIQLPLQSLGGTIGAMVIAVLVAHILWFFGIHGMMIVFSVLMPILTPIGLQNLEAYQKGLTPPNIVNGGMLLVYVLIGGSGATLGLNLLMMFKSKSKQYKTIGGMSILAGICGINEPLIFGLPIVLNPKLLIPFITAPTLNLILGYVFTKIGIIPVLNGMSLPLGTPIVAGAILTGNMRTVVFQIALVVVDLIIYLPFFNLIDKDAYIQETNVDESEVLEIKIA